MIYFYILRSYRTSSYPLWILVTYVHALLRSRDPHPSMIALRRHTRYLLYRHIAPPRLDANNYIIGFIISLFERSFLHMVYRTSSTVIL